MTGPRDTKNLGVHEQAILAMVRENPLLGQQEIADSMDLARSTVAGHIAQLTKQGYILGRGYVMPSQQFVVCVGGADLDRKYHVQDNFRFGTSNPANGHFNPGGVALNVVENLALLNAATGFISIVGNDETGRRILGQLRDHNIDVSQVIITSERKTAEYVAILDLHGDLIAGIADMDIYDLFVPACLDHIWSYLSAATWVFAECNLPVLTLATLIKRKRNARFKLAIDAVSTPKVTRLPEDLSGVDLIFMNHDEACIYLGREKDPHVTDAAEIAQALRGRGADTAIVTMGKGGIVVAGPQDTITYPALEAKVVDTTGAGDALIAGTLYGVLNGDDIHVAVRTGMLLAALTTESLDSVNKELSTHLLDQNRYRITE